MELARAQPVEGRMMIRTKFVATIAVAALTMPAIGRAQAPATPATPPPPTAIQNHPDANTDCAPSKLPNLNARPGVTTGQSPSDSAPLSDRLAAGNGVLCPPSGVDPEIRAPTPDAGKTPVIPPPGAPGSDRTQHPK
jgi:hypothetical protein